MQLRFTSKQSSSLMTRKTKEKKKIEKNNIAILCLLEKGPQFDILNVKSKPQEMEVLGLPRHSSKK